MLILFLNFLKFIFKLLSKYMSHLFLSLAGHCSGETKKLLSIQHILVPVFVQDDRWIRVAERQHFQIVLDCFRRRHLDGEAFVATG